MVATYYSVSGMTCEHCVRAVSEEVAKVAGVSSVTVDLDSGLLTVEGAEVDDRQVHAALDEAGYRVDARPSSDL